jgi:hypothetical protein
VQMVLKLYHFPSTRYLCSNLSFPMDYAIETLQGFYNL